MAGTVMDVTKKVVQKVQLMIVLMTTVAGNHGLVMATVMVKTKHLAVT